MSIYKDDVVRLMGYVHTDARESYNHVWLLSAIVYALLDVADAIRESCYQDDESLAETDEAK